MKAEVLIVIHLLWRFWGGSERPMFKIHSDNEWYSKFLKEIDDS